MRSGAGGRRRQCEVQGRCTAERAGATSGRVGRGAARVDREVIGKDGKVDRKVVGTGRRRARRARWRGGTGVSVRCKGGARRRERAPLREGWGEGLRGWSGRWLGRMGRWIGRWWGRAGAERNVCRVVWGAGVSVRCKGGARRSERDRRREGWGEGLRGWIGRWSGRWLGRMGRWIGRWWGRAGAERDARGGGGAPASV